MSTQQDTWSKIKKRPFIYINIAISIALVFVVLYLALSSNNGFLIYDTRYVESASISVKINDPSSFRVTDFDIENSDFLGVAIEVPQEVTSIDCDHVNDGGSETLSTISYFCLNNNFRSITFSDIKIPLQGTLTNSYKTSDIQKGCKVIKAQVDNTTSITLACSEGGF